MSQSSLYPRNPAAGRTLGEMIRKSTKKCYKKRPAAEQKLLLDWPLIVGDRWATISTPQKITGGRQGGIPTLHLLIDAPFALEAQHQEPVLLEKITRYLGYQAIQRISLIQRPVPL